MRTIDIINKLKNSDLYAECPCGGEFKLSDVILFDGTEPFPPEVKEIQERYEEELKQREEDLEKSRKLATERATITTTAVNIGKSLEKVFPTMDDFKWNIPDCRFLGDPIDLLTFNGCCQNNIQSISFIEVKSGKARLNENQRQVRDAVQDKKVLYEVF
jgi:predicted Holliday junction resolvase-like endonuclease